MQQPKPNTEKYGDITKCISEGKYQIPRFQRDFVWTKEQTADLIDSLIKGFPIGTFILWKTSDRLKSTKELGGEKLPEPKEDEEIYYVLDGQQRLTALHLALRGKKMGNYHYGEIYVDLSKTFETDDKICILEKTETSIPFYELMSVDPMDNIDKIGLELAKVWNGFRKSIEKYDFSTIEIKNQPLERIAEIFTRINTAGKDLDLFEIMNARIYTEDKVENGNVIEKGFDLEEKFDEFIEELEECGYETIVKSKTIILQYMSVVTGRTTKRRDILSIGKDEFMENWDRAIESIKKAIDEIRSCFKIPLSNLLPYPALIIPIAYFYKKNALKPADSAQQKMIEKYFFRAAVSYRYTSSADTKLGMDIKLIGDIAEENYDSIDWNKQVPIENVSENYFKEKLQEDFSTSLAFHKAVLCILANKEPESFSNNGSITLDNSWLSRASSKNYHHFFPKAFLKRQNNSKYANALANITFIDEISNKEISDKAPSAYLEEFKNNKNPSGIGKSLESHFIEYSEEFGTTNDNYDAFLEARATLLAREIRKRVLSDEDLEKEEKNKNEEKAE